MLSTEEIGYIGIGLYGSLFLISLERIYVHFLPYRAPWYSTRKLFHIFIAIYALLQTLSYVCFARGSSNFTKAAYTCHLLSIFSEVVAFSLIATLWSKYLLSANNAKNVIVPLLVGLDSIFLMYIIYIAIDLNLSSQSFVDWTSNRIFRELMIAEPVLLAINGGCIIYLGIRIYKKLTTHPSWEYLTEKEKKSVVVRLAITMSSCIIGFSMRSGLELYLYFDDAEGIGGDTWLIISTWIPTIMPICILLYALRKTDRLNNNRYVQEFCKKKKRHSKTRVSVASADNSRVSINTLHTKDSFGAISKWIHSLLGTHLESNVYEVSEGECSDSDYEYESESDDEIGSVTSSIGGNSMGSYHTRVSDIGDMESGVSNSKPNHTSRNSITFAPPAQATAHDLLGQAGPKDNPDDDNYVFSVVSPLLQDMADAGKNGEGGASHNSRGSQYLDHLNPYYRDSSEIMSKNQHNSHEKDMSDETIDFYQGAPSANGLYKYNKYGV